MANLLNAAQQGGFPGAGGNEPMVKFKAGRCEYEPRQGSTLWVKPVNRKGEVQLVKVDELLHFQWRDRTTMAVDPNCDHMIFPGDAKFDKVDTGRPEDRVYVLQFQQQASRRFFFWMQAKDESDDVSNVEKVNTAMNGGDAPTSEPEATETTPAAAETPATGGDNTLEFLQQLQTSTPATGSLTLGALQSAMAGLGMPPAAPLRLTDVANADAIVNSGIFDDPAVVERLLPHLPESQRSRDELVTILRAPQFRQAIQQLAAALGTPENFASVLANFQLHAPTTGAIDPVRAFLDAVQASVPPQEDTDMVDAPPPDEDKKDDDALGGGSA